jgi:hypothetical protein
METAFDLMDGRLTKLAEAEWAKHLSSCADCVAVQEDWRVLRYGLKRSHLQDAPPSMLDAARSLFQKAPVATERLGIRQILANLVFDSFTQPAFAGARGATGTRQMVLRSEEFDIHVRISVTDQSRELLGQIQPRENRPLDNAARLYLLHDGQRVSSAEVNDLGEFHFDSVPEGLLSLQIDLPHLTVVGALDGNKI